MADYTDLTSLFTDTADAIRTLDGTTDAIKPVDFPERIKAINVETFGYTAESTLNITNGSYSCTVKSPQVKGYHNAQLTTTVSPSNLGLTTLASSVMTASGKTVTVPAGYYSSSAVSKSVADGSYSLSGSVSSTPTATLKQTAGISLSDTETSYYITVGKSGSTGGSVTHSASITSGYIASGTSPTSNTATIVNANVTPETFYIPAASTTISTTSSVDPYSAVTPSESVQYLNFSAGYTPVATMKVNAISSTYVGSGVSKLAATTYNVSTSNQTIAAGKYLTGTQTIRGVTTSGISAANIKDGTTIQVGDSASSGRIASVIGTFTDSSTVSSGQTAASAAQIRSGYSAWVDGAEVKGSLANGTITNNTTLPSGSTSSGTITDGSYIKIGAGYYPGDKYYYAQNWAYKTNTPAVIDVNDLTITPNALVGTWDSTNSKYVISQASKSVTSQSTVTTAGYISSTVGTKNTGSVTVSAPSNIELAGSTWGTTSDSATYTSLSKGTKYKLSAGYYPSDRYYQTQSDPALSGTASAGNVLSGATFYSNSYTKQTGTMTNNGAVSATISTQGGTYTIPAGYHNGSGKVTASITAGSAKVDATSIPVTISGPTLNAKGIYMISVSGSKSITPSVTAGYVSSGTAGTVSVSDSTSIATSTFESATLPSGQTAIVTGYDTVYKISKGYNDDRYIQTPSYSTPYNAGYSIGKTDYNPSTATLSDTGSLVVKNAAGTQIYGSTFSNSYNAAMIKYEPYSSYIAKDGTVEVYNYAGDTILSGTTDNSYNAGVASVTMETLGYTAETALSGSLSGTTYTVSTPQTKGYHSAQLTMSVTPATLGLTTRTSLSRMRDAKNYTMTVTALAGYYASNTSTSVSATDLGYTQNTSITVRDDSDVDNNVYKASVYLPNAHGYNSANLLTEVTPENLGLAELTSSDITYASPYTIVIGQGAYTDADTNFSLTAADITVSATTTASPVVTPTLTGSNVGASTSTSSSYYITVSGTTTTNGSVTPKMTVDVPGVVDDSGEYPGTAVTTSANVSAKTIYIPASDSSTSTTASGTTYATITPSTSVQYRNFTAGYTPAGNFKIAAISTQELTVASQANEETTYDGSSKPYKTVNIMGYYRGYTTNHYYPRAQRVGSTTTYSGAVAHYAVTLSATRAVDSTTYYVLGTIAMDNYMLYLGGEAFPTSTLVNMGYCYEMYRTSPTGSLTSSQFPIYLYLLGGTTLYILTTSSTIYMPYATASGYGMWKIFSLPLIFLSKTNSSTPANVFTKGANSVDTSTTSRYSTTAISTANASDSNKEYYSLPSTWYGLNYSGLGYKYMYKWDAMYFYGTSTSNVLWGIRIAALTLG